MLCCMLGRCSDLAIEGSWLVMMERCNGGVAMDW